ncbi:MAG: YeeE/YedE family protein [Betaproteobacteria bacterium]
MDPQQLAFIVVCGGLAIGIVFGAVAQTTRFCTMGAIADWVNFGDATRLRLWVWAALVAAVGTQALIVVGGVDLSGSIYTGARLAWLSQALGGAMFGFGMVLASGCPSRALVRSAGGNLKALVVLLVVGLAAQMTLRGVFALPRVEGLDRVAWVLAGTQDLPSWLARSTGLQPGPLRLGVVALLGAALLPWLLRSAEFRRPGPLLGGLTVGVLVVLAWWTTGQIGFVPEHPETLEAAWLATDSGRPEALSFVAPTAYGLELLTLWSDRSTTLSFGVATALGTLLGALALTLARREFRWEAFRDAGDMGQHLLGALLMGVGGVTALGCSIGQGLSGLSQLSAGSVIAVAGIAAGAVAALRWQAWRIEREG